MRDIGFGVDCVWINMLRFCPVQAIIKIKPVKYIFISNIKYIQKLSTVFQLDKHNKILKYAKFTNMMVTRDQINCYAMNIHICIKVKKKYKLFRCNRECINVSKSLWSCFINKQNTQTHYLFPRWDLQDW